MKNIEQSKRMKQWWIDHPNATGANKGKVLNDDIRSKMSLAKIGKKRKPLTEEHKQKLRDILEINRYKGKPTRYCIDCGIAMNKHNKNERCPDCNRKFKRQYRIDNGLNKSSDYHIIRCSKEFKDWRKRTTTWRNFRKGQGGKDLKLRDQIEQEKRREVDTRKDGKEEGKGKEIGKQCGG